MNLFPKILFLSCLITSGLHCGFPEESFMEKQGMQLQITALLEVLKRCDQRDIYSLGTLRDAQERGNRAFQAFLNERATCELAQENLLKIMEKIRDNSSDIKVELPVTQ